MNAIILCAGMGKRLRPYSQSRPKPALGFLGAPMMSYSYYYLSHLQKLDHVVVNVHHLASKMSQVAQSVIQKHPLLISDEASKLMDTGGGLVKAAKLLSEKKETLNSFEEDDVIFSFNGDSIFLHPQPDFLNNVVQWHRESKSQVTLILTKAPFLKEDVFAPVYYCEKTHKVSFQEKPSFSSSLYIGGMLISSKLLHKMPQGKPFGIFYEGLSQLSEVYGYFDSQILWFETGSVESYVRSSFTVARLLKKNSLFLKDFPFDSIFSYSNFKEKDFKKLLFTSSRL